MLDLLLMHIARTDRADSDVLILTPQCKGDENAPASLGFANADEALLIGRVRRIWKDRDWTLENALDGLNREAVPFAFCAVGFVPIEFE